MLLVILGQQLRIAYPPSNRWLLISPIREYRVSISPDLIFLIFLPPFV
jgi:hypothetical protein